MRHSSGYEKVPDKSKGGNHLLIIQLKEKTNNLLHEIKQILANNLPHLMKGSDRPLMESLCGIGNSLLAIAETIDKLVAKQGEFPLTIKYDDKRGILKKWTCKNLQEEYQLCNSLKGKIGKFENDLEKFKKENNFKEALRKEASSSHSSIEKSLHKKSIKTESTDDTLEIRKKAQLRDVTETEDDASHQFNNADSDREDNSKEEEDAYSRSDGEVENVFNKGPST